MPTYQIDPTHSALNFSVKHLMMSRVQGGFKKFQGIFLFDPDHLEASTVAITIEGTSLFTNDQERDAHLKSDAFFDFEKYPTLTFTSTHFEKKGRKLLVMGQLTIHGVTQNVDLEITIDVPHVVGSTIIKRKDFNLKWNAALEAGGFLVGDEVRITFSVQLKKELPFQTGP